jgi:hypothetical protein
MEARADKTYYQLYVGRRIKTGVGENPAVLDFYISPNCDFVITENLYVFTQM